jgi:hypothetical protein
MDDKHMLKACFAAVQRAVAGGTGDWVSAGNKKGTCIQYKFPSKQKEHKAPNFTINVQIRQKSVRSKIHSFVYRQDGLELSV